MAKQFIQADYSDNSHKVSIGVTLIHWQEDDVYYQYSPELDLTGYGLNEIEAKQSFEHTLEDFIKYTLNKGTIYAELERLGWTTNKKKKRLSAPPEDLLLESNKTYKDLIGMKNIQRSKTDFAVSL